MTFDLLTLKVVSESRVTWATHVPILVFLSLFVLDLGPMYTTDRRQTKTLPIRDGGIIMHCDTQITTYRTVMWHEIGR